VRLFFLIGLCLLPQINWAAEQSDPFPQVANAYWVELNGNAIWARQAQRQMPIASLTKLMTALLVLEQNQLEDIVSITAPATRETGSRIALKIGERFTVQDLLAATLISSANDACHALADHLAGSETAFVKLMNERAKKLGLRDTKFQNACGHDMPSHYSSAYDLSLLAHELVRHPQALLLTSKPSATIFTTSGKKYLLKNKNMLIGKYKGASGLKTGFTAQAGKCLIAYAKRGEHEVLLVMLHGNDRWWDAADILDIAFDHARIAQ
jgi:D-alanyl-D-alanine carboxypeptidase (penicillin-binding protein 5/6)